MKRMMTLAAAALALAAASAQTVPAYLNESLPLEQRVDDALQRMTLKEKVDLCHAQSKFSAAGVPRLGIPDTWCDDGPHGVRPEVLWDEWTQAGWTNDSCMAFPALSCLAASWDPALSLAYGKALGEEARFRNKTVILGPGVNICRSPLGGRNFEYLSEDPYLASIMCVPYIEGVQSNGVATCVKHFAVNNQERNRGFVDVKVDDRSLHEIYLRPFEAALTKGHSWSLMAAYNKYKGQFLCENKPLINDIVRGEWGYDGVVISDWGGVHSTEATAKWGVDMEFATNTDGLTINNNAYSTYYLADPYLEAMKSGKVDSATVNEKARRILRMKLRTDMNRQRPLGSMNSPEHSAVGLKVASEGIVLLQNKGGFLPLDPSKNLKIAVIGENAKRYMTRGGGSSQLKVKYEVTPLEGIEREFGKQNVTWARGYCAPPMGKQDNIDIDEGLTAGEDAQQLFSQAVEAARKADVVIFVGGLNHGKGGDCEGQDKSTLQLPYGQDELIKAISKVNKNVAVVLVAGSQVTMPWLQDVKSVLLTWYGGSEAGNADAQVLSGKVNPSGKLPVTFYASLQQCGAHAIAGAFDNDGPTTTYLDSIWVGYRYVEKQKLKPLFPFGFGLSYTQFKYGKATLSAPSLNNGGSITVSVPVTNVGSRAGAEVVQLYIAPAGKTALPRPIKELKGFTKLQLNPGETKVATITITPEQLQYYNPSLNAWTADAGRYTAIIGASSQDLKARLPFTLK